VSSGQLTLSGRRLPELWVNLRTAGNILFIPALLGIFFTAILWASGSSIALALCVLSVALFAFSVGVLIFTDIWFPGHGPIESASWAVGATTDLKRVKDSTNSAGFLLPSMAMRALSGKNALRLRVPVGPAQAPRTLVLRAQPDTLIALEALLSR
jgi:hypothetical protein